jgi:ABC-2 type transport system permease protein
VVGLKNENQAAPFGEFSYISNDVSFGNVSSLVFMMPEWLQSVSEFLPLTPVVDSARLIITEGKTLFDLLPQFGMLAAWAFVIYFIAFRVFRWE